MIVPEAYQTSGIGQIYCAFATITAPVIYSTAAGTGGPLLWNGSALNSQKGVTAYLLAVSFGVVTANTVAGMIGITGNTGQPAAPTSTTAITTNGNLKIGGQASACTAYSVGTVVSAGNFFVPVGAVDTGATTTVPTDDNWVDLGGAIVIPTGCWASVAASATLTAAVMAIGLIWSEVPNA